MLGTYLGSLFQLPQSFFRDAVPAAAVTSSQLTADLPGAASASRSYGNLDSAEAAAGSTEASAHHETSATEEGTAPAAAGEMPLSHSIKQDGGGTCTACGIGASLTFLLLCEEGNLS